MSGPLPPREGPAVVGVTANRLVEDGVHRDWLRRRYLDALEAHAGVAAVILPTGVPPAPSLARLDGLLLTGDESDLDAAVFAGDAAGSGGADYERDRRDRHRDRLSSAALEAALARGMPVLGICRGLQELNVHRGGTLHPSLAARPGGLDHREDVRLPRDRQYDPVHPVTLAPDGVLRRIVGAGALRVNSLHGQGIATLGRGLAVEAVAPDGLVEAVRVADAPALQLAVQWHPEWHAAHDPASRAIFRAFGEACRAFRAAREGQVPPSRGRSVAPPPPTAEPELSR